MTDNYIIAFSSFYKAAYAQEKLSDARIKTVAKRLPTDVMRSCGYALYLNASSMQIQNVISVLEQSEIGHRGIYIVDEKEGKTLYKRIA